MLRQHSLLLSLVVALFLSISSVWAKNVTVTMDDDKRLTFSNSTSWTGGWQHKSSGGLCNDYGGIAYTYTQGDWVRMRFNGTAIYVVLAEYNGAAMTTVTIDGVLANVTASNSYLTLTSIDCQTRTLYAANLTNTNHTVTVSYAGNGLGYTVLNTLVFDDGSETERASPTATRAPVTILDTGAAPTSTSSAASNDSGCGTHCKTYSIGGAASLIITLIILWWLWRCCCGRRTHVVETHTVAVVRPLSPPPQPIVVVAARYEIQENHIQIQSLNRVSTPAAAAAAAASPPAYDQTNYK